MTNTLSLDCDILSLCNRILDNIGKPSQGNPLGPILKMVPSLMFHVEGERDLVRTLDECKKPNADEKLALRHSVWRLGRAIKLTREKRTGAEHCPSMKSLKLYLRLGVAESFMKKRQIIDEFSSLIDKEWTGAFLRDASDLRLPALCKEFADVCACLTCVAGRRWGFNCSSEVFVIRQTKPWVLYAASKSKRAKDEGIQTDNYAMKKQTKWTHWFNAFRLEDRFQFFDSSMYNTQIKRPEHFTNLDVADIKLTPPFTSSDGNWINPRYNPKPTESCLGSPKYWHSWKIKEHEEAMIIDPS